MHLQSHRIRSCRGSQTGVSIEVRRSGKNSKLGREKSTLGRGGTDTKPGAGHVVAGEPIELGLFFFSKCMRACETRIFAHIKFAFRGVEIWFWSFFFFP